MEELTRKKRTHPRTEWEWARSVVFVLLLCLPGARWIASGALFVAAPEGEAPTSYSRAHARRDSPVGPFLSRFETRFGFRKELIRARALLMIRVLGVSGSDRTMVGRNGWHFLTEESPKAGRRAALLYTRNVLPLSETEASSAARGLEALRARTASAGMRYLLVVAPNKESIYPDQLPRGFEYARPDSRLDQLLGALRKESELDILDLRAPLREARQRGEPYFKTDTHWNQLGALIAQEAIIGALRKDFPMLRPLTLADFDLSFERRPGGDLARIVGLQEELAEEVPVLRPREPTGVRGAGPATSFEGRDVRPISELVTECPGAPVGRAVILRDSFGEALIPLLSPHFRRAVYLWNDPTGIDWPRISKERPEIVIHEVVERSLLDIGGLYRMRPPADGHPILPLPGLER